MGSGAKPQPTSDLVHIRTKKNGSGGNSFKDFPTNNIYFFLHTSGMPLFSQIEVVLVWVESHATTVDWVRVGLASLASL